MEIESHSPIMGGNSTVDTTRPFSSVKEAVAIFGEKILSGELYSSPTFFNISTPKQESSTKVERDIYSSSHTSFSKQDSSSSSSSSSISSPIPSNAKDGEHSPIETLKRLELELEETKAELKLMKKRESETEIALASLHAELHKNMSKIAQSEAKAAATTRTNNFGEGERKRELVMKMNEGSSPSLTQILGFRGERGMRKKKPVVPIITHLFSRKKVGANDWLHTSLFASTHVNLN